MHKARFLIAPFQLLYCLYAYSLAVIIIISLIPCLILCLPLGKFRGGNIMFEIYRVLGNVFFLLIGIRHVNHYESKPAANEQYIFIPNHISYLDAIVVILAIKHHFRAIGKYELLQVPIFGFLYKFCVITVNRSSPEDRARSLNDLRKTLARGISIWRMALWLKCTMVLLNWPLRQERNYSPSFFWIPTTACISGISLPLAQEGQGLYTLHPLTLQITLVPIQKR